MLKYGMPKYYMRKSARHTCNKSFSLSKHSNHLFTVASSLHVNDIMHFGGTSYFVFDKARLPTARLRFKVMDVFDARKGGWKRSAS